MLFSEVFPMLVSRPAGKIKRIPWVRDYLTFNQDNGLTYMHDGMPSDRKVSLESLAANDWEFIAPIAPAADAVATPYCPHCGMNLKVTLHR